MFLMWYPSDCVFIVDAWSGQRESAELSVMDRQYVPDEMSQWLHYMTLHNGMQCDKLQVQCQCRIGDGHQHVRS